MRLSIATSQNYKKLKSHWDCYSTNDKFNDRKDKERRNSLAKVRHHIRLEIFRWKNEIRRSRTLLNLNHLKWTHQVYWIVPWAQKVAFKSPSKQSKISGNLAIKLTLI